MGGGTVQSSFECVASGPSGCRCERSSWCAAHKAICSESVELVHIKRHCFTVLREQNFTVKTEKQILLHITDWISWPQDMTSTCSATMPPCHHYCGCLAAQLRGGRWPQLCPVRFVSRGVSFCSTEASARRLGSHPHLGKPRQVSPIFVWMSWVTWLVG